MEKSLILICPHCRKLCGCKSLETVADHSAYQFKGFFEELTEKESSFRVSSRQCKRCEEDFTTVEIEEQVLNLIKEKFDLLITVNTNVEKQLDIALNELKNNQYKKVKSNNSKVENYIDFVKELFGKSSFKWFFGSESELKEYFLTNNAEPFVNVVNETISTLPYDQRTVLEMRFGFNKSNSKRKLNEIGEWLSKKEIQIQKIEDNAFEKLKETGKDTVIVEFLADYKKGLVLDSV